MVIVVGEECLTENHAIPPRGPNAIRRVKMTLSLEIGADTHYLFLLVINQCVQGLDTKNLLTWMTYRPRRMPCPPLDQLPKKQLRGSDMAFSSLPRSHTVPSLKKRTFA
ncbi:hypothetical protein VNO77_03227 [Canavalia gladiata]|uniref:Uncharacterized protein n=1 Tax=Canavalia gladiata TaxID=3824 RepID=A0AAN9MWD4_CANGL